MTKPRKPLSKRFKIAVVIFSLILVSLLAIGAYLFVTVFWAPQKQQTTTDQTDNYVQKTESINTTTDLKKVVDENGVAAMEASRHAYNTNSLEWTNDDVDKAYFAMVYAAKIGNFTDVLNLNNKLKDAEAAGKNTSGDRVGVSQEQREQYVQDAKKLIGDRR